MAITTNIDQTTHPISATVEYPTYDIREAGGMIVYATASAGFMTLDEAGTVKLKKAEALKMFLCGKLIIKMAGKFYVPTLYDDGTVTSGSVTFKAE